MKVHTIVCAAYDFKVGLAELEIPDHVFSKLSPGFHKIWMSQAKPNSAKNGKKAYLFGLTDVATKTTIKTALTKDHGIFDSKVNPVVLAESWSKYLRKKGSGSTQQKVDWSEAERAAKRYNEHTVQQINDGKTFNAQKDNPWARKHLKNWKNQQG
jgi:hypothetical protein